VASIEEEILDTACSMRLRSMVSAVELILDAEVIELI
jgi:hypothetical protein